jgi:hypothetical protein
MASLVSPCSGTLGTARLVLKSPGGTARGGPDFEQFYAAAFRRMITFIFDLAANPVGNRVEDTL